MNRIRKITVTQFKNYSTGSFDFPNLITCVTGLNGSGKTNLLDAIYYLCYTKSYFTGSQQLNVRSGADGLRLEGLFEKEDAEEQVVCKWKGGKKEIMLNGVPYEKVTEHIGRHTAVIVAPDDLETINGGSELRRRWIDAVLGQSDGAYLSHLITYQRILAQRNAWLKMQTSPNATGSELEFYNHELSRAGNFIYQRRKVFIETFKPILQHFYGLLSAEREPVDITYQSDLSEQSMLAWLQKERAQDLRAQRTTRGIHKDDLILLLQNKNIRQYGSQGQKKTMLFALKLGQYRYLSETLHFLPILLLDDVFEKLDQQRMEALLRVIQTSDFDQVILTDTHKDRVQHAFGSVADFGLISL